MKNLCVMLILNLVMCISHTNANTAEVSPQYIIVDDYKGVSLHNRQWYYTRIGTDRGAMGDENGSYTANIGGGTAAVTVQSGWGGVWTALKHNAATNDELNPKQLLGPYIKSQYQPNISGIEVDIIAGSGKFKIELKDKNDNFVVQKTFHLYGGQRTLQFSFSPAVEIAKLNWVVDGPGYATVDVVRFTIESPDYTVLEAVFLFTYGHLSQCYDSDSGLVRDRARWPVQDFAAVQAIGTFSLATAIARDLGYVTDSTARNIIQKTKNTILNILRHNKGLLPHYLKDGNIVENTEWSSVDTVITLIAEILACQAVGEDTSPLESMLKAIDWNDLTDNGTHSISMGYDYNGQKLKNTWDTFGAEALLLAIAYSAATGDSNVLLDQYSGSPTWDGSGFNDELAALFFPTYGTDIWGNNWSQYRQEAFDRQTSYFANHYYAADGLFGLSASEVPEPWTVEENDIYKAWGVGGHNNQANDGTSLVGFPIIAPHYAAVVAAEHPDYFETLFHYLLETQKIFTPLNNVESFGIDSSDNLRWNSLKGSWNLSLQVLGVSRALSNGNYLPYQALNENNFLNQGFNKIIAPFITVTSPDGGESWQQGSYQTITWMSTGLTGNLAIDLYKSGSFLFNIGSAAVDAGIFSWDIPSDLAAGDDYQIRIHQGAVDDYSKNDFSISSSAPPGIILSRSVLNFGAAQSQTTASQDVLVSNSGGGTLYWTATANQNWLLVKQGNGTGDGIVTVSINASGLSAGNYQGYVTVEDPNASNSPQVVKVSLKVYPEGFSDKPFGSFATPLDGSTLRSSIPVTGWVLDDIEVSSVKIYRVQGNSQIFIGDALLVEGARPDVEQAYPEYPFNYKAGWGYMMLTNFLPNGGNGTYTINARATDKEGNEVTLGTKNIHCDNTNAVKPFGAIDTPTQGGTASGSSFINWGWVLTPQPNSIPTNGSTIDVWVNGVNIGHPAYNIYRSDIATLFPGYANSNGAIGYFYLDTTAYTPGVHTIYWTARDTNGNSDGIGSRYFSISNTGSSDSGKQSYMYKAKPKTPIYNFSQINELPIDCSIPVRIRQGFKEDSLPQPTPMDEKGINRILIKEVGRVEIYLKDESAITNTNGFTYSGYLVIGNQLHCLPIGSTFDKKRGILYWQAGPGFLGQFHLVFVITDPNGKKTKKDIIIEIVP